MEFMNLTGLFWGKKVHSNNLNIDFTEEEIAKNIHRLTNQLWKLIPMRENEEDWHKQLNTLIIEIAGLKEIFDNPLFLQLLSKLKGLQVEDTTFEDYRKNVFECINILRGSNNVAR